MIKGLTVQEYNKKYRQENLEKLLIRNRIYYQNNKKEIARKRKIYDENTKEIRKTYQAEYRKKNKTTLLIKGRISNHKYYLKNKSKINAYKKQYRKDHPEIFLKGQIKYCNKLGKIYNLSARMYKLVLQSWSKAIRSRDNHICQVCGIRDEIKNIAHHILHKAHYPHLAFNINNGITLCYKCHRECHQFI